jgi:hypothetical protein
VPRGSGCAHGLAGQLGNEVSCAGERDRLNSEMVVESRLGKSVGYLGREEMRRVAAALRTVLDL